MPWHTHRWFLALFYVCAFVWTDGDGCGAGAPFCIVIYVELFSHRASRRRPVVNSRRYTWEKVSESRVWGVAMGKRSVEWMEKKFQTMEIFISLFALSLSLHSLANSREMGISWTSLHSCVVSPACSQCAKRRPTSYPGRVEINFPRLAENGRHASSCCPAVGGRDFPSTPVLTEWRPLSLASNRRPRG